MTEPSPDDHRLARETLSFLAQKFSLEEHLTMLATRFAEIRREEKERAAGIIDAMRADCTCEGRWCESYGCSSLKKLAAKIRGEPINGEAPHMQAPASPFVGKFKYGGLQQSASVCLCPQVRQLTGDGDLLCWGCSRADRRKEPRPKLCPRCEDCGVIHIGSCSRVPAALREKQG